METNQQATQNETAVWYEVQRESGPDYGWITLSDHDTREQAEEAMDARLGINRNRSEFSRHFRVQPVRGVVQHDEYTSAPQGEEQAIYDYAERDYGDEYYD